MYGHNPSDNIDDHPSVLVNDFLLTFLILLSTLADVLSYLYQCLLVSLKLGVLALHIGLNQLDRFTNGLRDVVPLSR